MDTFQSRHIAILDVGHGNCAVLEDEEGVVVIDAGPGGSLLQYLEDRRIEVIDLVLLSHADQESHRRSGGFACKQYSVGAGGSPLILTR